MGTSRWKPLPSDLPEAARDLAEQLRTLLDREGMSLRRLAADSDVPYSLTTLQRFFSGQALPSPELLAVIARKCHGDLPELRGYLDNARQASRSTAPAEPDRSRSTTTARLNRWRRDVRGNLVGALRGRRRYAVVAAAVVAAAGVVLAATLLDNPRDRRLTSPAVGPAPAPSSQSVSPSGSPTPSESRTPRPSRRPGRGSDPDSGSGRESTSRPGPRNTSRRPAAPSEPRSSGTQLVGNGTFFGTTSGWAAYDGVRIRTESSRLRADVPAGGSQLPDRHFRYAEFPVHSGSTYTFRFDAAADSSLTIRVVVKDNPPPYTKALDRTITLSSSTRRFSYRFTSSLSTSQGAIAFYVGGHSSDHIVRVDNVSLVRGG